MIPPLKVPVLLFIAYLAYEIYASKITDFLFSFVCKSLESVQNLIYTENINQQFSKFGFEDR